jgi:AcrR family transcriptional regulator
MDRPRKKRTRKSKDERRREIVEATLKLIPEHGFHGTTVSRIAGKAGLSRGALYHHFANREAVLFAAFELLAERASPWISASSSSDAYRRLLDAGASHAAFSASEFDSFVLPNVELMASSGRSTVAEQVRERQRKVIQVFVELVDAGKRDGSIRSDVESEDIAWALLTFAWAEDLALVMGLDEFVGSGASVRNFRRTLAGIGAVAPEEARAPVGPGKEAHGPQES